MFHLIYPNRIHKTIKTKSIATTKKSKWHLFLHLSAVVLLTAITQIGGVLYLIVILISRKLKCQKILIRLLIFISLYAISSLYIVPKIAAYFGRQKIETTAFVQPHSSFYSWCNRNYVTTELHQVLQRIGNQLSNHHTGIKLVYLDANFPFLDGFPLLPHRYHNDGKKIDISFVYQDGATLTNKKPSFSGYGIFEAPLVEEWNQINQCLETGYSQYEFTKYVTFGNIHPQLTFSEAVNREFIIDLLAEEEVHTIFIEPHLKTRLGLENDKFVYHGCGTVRHDDHIHIEVN